MSEEQQAKFDGWAVVDVMGHQRYAGYVTTEAYGAAVLFRIEVPALEARERTMKRPGYVGDKYCPAGTKVLCGAVQGYSKLIGAGSIYSMTPCTREAALAAVEEIQPRPLTLVDITDATKRLEGGAVPDGVPDEHDDDADNDEEGEDDGEF